jgi:hypothetical protein
LVRQVADGESKGAGVLIFPNAIRSFVALVFSGVAFAGSYTVSVILPPSGFTGVNMSCINNSGQTAGYGVNGTGFAQAFIGSPSGSVTTPFPTGWATAQSSAINNSGQITGFVSPADLSKPFIGATSGSVTIPLPAGWIQAIGLAINSSGQVAGWGSGFTTQAFIGNTSSSTAIPFPAGSNFTEGYGINDSGQVTGYAGIAATTQAFIGTAAGSAVIPLPGGWSSSAGDAINSSGQVAGYGFTGSTYQAFLVTASGSTVIPLPPGAVEAQVTRGSLNDSGSVVGYSDAGGWIWSAAAGTQLLNTLVPVGWNIQTAYSISQNGLILAAGSFDGGPGQYVVLTPAVATTPAPAAGFLALAGTLLLLTWRLLFHRAARRDRGDPA